MASPDPILETVRLLLRRDPAAGRTHLDHLIVLYESNAAYYATLLASLDACTTSDEPSIHGSARELLAAEHRRFSYLTDNAHAFRAGLSP